MEIGIGGSYGAARYKPLSSGSVRSVIMQIYSLYRDWCEVGVELADMFTCFTPLYVSHVRLDGGSCTIPKIGTQRRLGAGGQAAAVEWRGSERKGDRREMSTYLLFILICICMA